MKNSQAQSDRRYGARGATLIEILAIVALIGFVLLGAQFAHRRYDGEWGWLLGGWGWLLGGVVGFLAFFLVVATTALVWDAFKGMPRLPRCKNGCCRGPGMFMGYGDYEIVEHGDKYYRKCRCGIWHKRSGQRFVTVNEDGTENPHLVWRPFRGWFPDNEGFS